jgi:DNA-cytosine methyltransferase
MTKKYKHLDLFSGIGGFSLGLEATGAFETVAFCDYDPYCQKVLRKHWPWVTIYDDVKELNNERLSANGHTEVDIITGGYPCQPFSIAGRKKGEQDPRHVWPEMFRLVKELRPTWVIGENVSGHIKLGLDTVLENLESEGYSARAFSISASSIGANHQRERVWILAHSGCTQHEGSMFGDQDEDETREGHANQFERSSKTSQFDVADTESVSSYDRTKCEHTQESDEKGQVRSEVRGINSNVADSDIYGHIGRSFEECYQINTREELQEFWRKSSNKTFRQSDDGGDTEKPRVDENLSGSSVSGETHATQSNGVCGVPTQSDIGQGVVSTDLSQENNDRTLVSERQSRLRLSQHRGLGDDKKTSKGDKIRQGDDNFNKQRMENPTNTDIEGLEGRWSQCELQEGQGEGETGWSQWWQFEPNVGRVAHGVPKRVDRLKSLGNSLVPMIPYYIGMSIKKGDEIWKKSN